LYARSPCRQPKPLYQENAREDQKSGAVNPTAYEEFQEASLRQISSPRSARISSIIRDTETAIKEIDRDFESAL